MAHYEVIATAEPFLDIRCPYTGRPVETVMVMSPGEPEPMFRAADGTYSPRSPVQSRSDAVRLACRSCGSRPAPEPTDAYTGRRLGDPDRFDSASWWFPSAFSPTRLRTREEYLYFMHMRAGEPDPRFPRPSPPVRVRPVAEKPAPRPTHPAGQDISQDSIDFAKLAVETSGCAERSPTVGVGPHPRRRKGRK